MDIDPFKIPAFQRKSKISFGKGSSYRLPKEFEIQKEARIRRIQQEQKKSFEFKKESSEQSILVSRKEPIFQRPALELTPVNKSVSDDGTTEMPLWRKMERIGEVEHYFEKINVIAFKLLKPLRIGEHILIESPKGLFEEKLSSMQINKKDVMGARKGDDIGIKIKFQPKAGGAIYKVVAKGN